jgi:hypothetical protein
MHPATLSGRPAIAPGVISDSGQIANPITNSSRSPTDDRG